MGTNEATNEELAEAVRQAVLNEGLYRAVLATALDPVILINEAGMMLEANAATSRLFGYTNEQLIGNNVAMLMPEHYAEKHDSYIQRYLDTGEPRIIGTGREVEARRADGTIFPIHLSVSEVQGPESRMFTGMIHDLTEQHRSAELLRRTNEELEARVAARTAELARSNRDLEQFAYIASHDLRAPLRNVRQGLELLDDHLTETGGVGFDAEAAELRDLVVGAVVRMEDLIAGLLSYSRLPRGSPITDLVDLNDVVDEALDNLRMDLADTDATVHVGDLPCVRGDRIQLLQLFENLIQNSIKYRAADEPPQISIEVGEGSDGALVTVTDNGVGVDRAMHERIFELFRRGHAGYDGVGIGLAICQRIVERHGGRIWVDSSPGEGASFRFTLRNGDGSDV